MKVELDGKVALVTGSAQGIGQAIADTLARNGARVVYSDLDADRAAAASKAGGGCLGFALDVGQPDSVVAGVARVIQEFGRVDILINNAGIGVPAAERKTIDDYSLEAWDALLRIDLTGLFLMSREASRAMKTQKSGRIINIASIAGLNGNPEGMNTIAYNTSKGAVLNFTRALGAEWGKYNIRVNAICPGFFPSKMTAGTLQALGEEALAAHAPLGRLGDDEDLKGLCLLYASDAGKHITGQWLAVDGGVSIVTGG